MSEAAEIVQVVAEADDAVTDRIGWVIEKIAGEGYTPAEPGKPWAGRMAIVAAAMEQFAISEPQADHLVALAQASLWASSRESGQVQRRLMLQRMNTLRQVIIDGLKKPRGSVVWGYVTKKKNGKVIRNAEGNPVFYKVPKRETETRGLDVYAIRLLLDIEKAIAELESLADTGGNDEMLARIFARIEQDSDGNRKTSTAVTLEQVKKASPAAQAVIARALEQHGRRKKVEAQEVKDERPDD